MSRDTKYPVAPGTHQTPKPFETVAKDLSETTSDNSLPEGDGSVKPMMPGDKTLKGSEFYPHNS